VSISLPDLGLHAGVHIQESNTQLGSAKAVTGGGLGFIQTIVDSDRPVDEVTVGLCQG